jgi:hypothetical protein
MSNIETAEETLTGAIGHYFPDLALVAFGTPEDAVLIDLLVRVNPDVKILWLGDEAGLEAIKTKYYVTPIHVKGSLFRAIREWNLKAIVRSERREPALEKNGDLRIVRPLATWTAAQVKSYLRNNAVPVEVRS